MLVLNGTKLAENEKEFIDSLFSIGGTCSGYIKVNKRSISILNQQKEKVGVINRHGVLCCATKLKDGKWWYNFADIKIIGRYESHIQEVNECESALEKYCEHIFKEVK
jgi:hypothetical protein